jgi:phospholipid:diacylglycerol acyltransferase
MSELRRRIFGSGDETPDNTPSQSRDASPAPAPKEAGGDAYRVITKDRLDQLRKSVKVSKGRKRRNFWVFVLGGLFGLVVAGFFASRDGALEQLVTLAGLEDMNLDSLLDVLPTGLIRDVQKLQVCVFCWCRPRFVELMMS